MDIKIWWHLLFLALILTTSVLIFPSDRRLADLFDTAGQYNRAIAGYEKALRKDPDLSHIRLRLLNLYVLSNRYGEAIALYEKMPTNISLPDDLLEKLSQICSAKGRKEITLEILQLLAANHPDREHRIRLADAHIWNGNWSVATSICELLLKQTPDDVAILKKLISVDLTLKRFEMASPRLHRVVELDPDDAEAAKLLAILLIRENRKNEAAQTIENLLTRFPADIASREKLAELYLWTGDYKNGVRHYETLFDAHPDSERYFMKLVQLTQTREAERTITYFDKYLARTPKDKELRIKFVELLRYFGETGRAINQLRILHDMEPKNHGYMLKLAELFENTHEFERAAEVWQELIDEGYLEQDVVSKLLAYYQLEKKLDRLEQLYSDLIDKDAATESQRMSYSQLLLARGDRPGAAKQLQALLTANTHNFTYRMTLANVWLGLGEQEKAISLVTEALKEAAEQKDEPFLSYAADMLLRNGRIDDGLWCSEKLSTFDTPASYFYRTALISDYARYGRLEDAIRQNRALVQANPGNADPKFSLASLYWQANDFDHMNEVVTNIRRFHRKENRIPFRIAEFFFERRFLDETIGQLNSNLKTLPNDSTSLRMLGLSYAWNNEPDESIEILTKYHRLFPADYYTHFQLGELWMLKHKEKKAFAEFDQALSLLDLEVPDRETALARARISVHMDQPETAIAEFESLIDAYPDDISLKADYAESLGKLNRHDDAEAILLAILEHHPEDYRSLRLLANNYLDQNDYESAAEILRILYEKHPREHALGVDLADVQTAEGDLHGSQVTLASLLRDAPQYRPARERLRYLQRINPEGFSSRVSSEEQGGGIIKKRAELAISRVDASWIKFRAYMSQERYEGDRHITEDATGIEIGMKYSKHLETISSVSVSRLSDNWYMSGKTGFKLSFSTSNSLTVQGEINQLWSDPFQAAYHCGRRDQIGYDLNLSPRGRFFIWTRMSAERHRTRDISHFGDAYRGYLQLGYQWSYKPQFSTHYQYYRLKYDYPNAVNRAIISIPEKDSAHYLGISFSQQMTSNLFVRMGGSVGYNLDSHAYRFFNNVELEYAVKNHLRLISKIEFGSQGGLTSNAGSRSIVLGLWYHGN